jgi:hypothetical protein
VEPETVQTVFDWMKISGVEASKVFDNSIIENIKQQGFIENLYQQGGS